jgi:hypothetical protein
MTCDISLEYGLGVDDGSDEFVGVNLSDPVDWWGDVLSSSANELLIDWHKFISFGNVMNDTILFYDL